MREIGRIIRRFAPTNNSPVSQALYAIRIMVLGTGVACLVIVAILRWNISIEESGDIGRTAFLSPGVYPYLGFILIVLALVSIKNWIATLRKNPDAKWYQYMTILPLILASYLIFQP